MNKYENDSISYVLAMIFTFIAFIAVPPWGVLVSIPFVAVPILINKYINKLNRDLFDQVVRVNRELSELYSKGRVGAVTLSGNHEAIEPRIMLKNGTPVSFGEITSTINLLNEFGNDYLKETNSGIIQYLYEIGVLYKIIDQSGEYFRLPLDWSINNAILKLKLALKD